MHDDTASAEELAALRDAVLRSHDQSLRLEPTPRGLRVARRLQRLHLSWLAAPWAVVHVVRLFLPAFRGGGFDAGEEQAVRLYRRLGGKDPQVSWAEMSRLGMQLRELDDRLGDLDEEERWAVRGASPDELEIALGALLGYYLAGRQTDDELLGQVVVAWDEYEDLFEQLVDRARQRRRPDRHPADPSVEERVRAAADRYRGGWRRWFDRRAERGPATGARQA